MMSTVPPDRFASTPAVDLSALDGGELAELSGALERAQGKFIGAPGSTPAILRAVADGAIVTWEVRWAVRERLAAALAPADLLTVLGALSDAAQARTDAAESWCADCEAHPAGCCESHADDLDQAAAYKALAERLGDDR